MNRLSAIRAITAIVLMASVVAFVQSKANPILAGGVSLSSTQTPAPPSAPRASVAATPSPTPKAIYKGHTIEEIAADPALLEEILSKADYLAPGGVRIGENGEADPLSVRLS